MNKEIRANVIRIVLFVLLQVLLLKDIQIMTGSVQYLYLMVYPLSIIMLPLAMPQFFLLLTAFGLGFFVDLFYQSVGVHASACLWLAAARPFILRYLEPKSGYSTGLILSGGSLGIFWFLQYISICLLVFFFSYFCMEMFSFVYLGTILIKTIVSLFVSGMIIFLIQIIWNPKY
ncbi:MAG: hypothetical protein IPM48_05865 [Saprospiraceae bacterium]|nr:hypothetical protein [Saprospiraceae bacterium]